MANSLEENQQTERIWFGIDTSSEKSALSPLEGNLSQVFTVQNAKEATSKMQNGSKLRQDLFNVYLVEAVDEAIRTLGEAVKNSLYQHLEQDFCMPKQEIATRIDEFDDIIHKIFGLGASRLEFKFIKNLDSKIHGNNNGSECELSLSKWIGLEISFKQYVDAVRREFEQTEAEMR